MSGEVITRLTVRGALLLYAATVALRLVRPSSGRAARLLWTIGCGLFLAHVVAAFHFFHGWSHAHAYRETARQTGDLVGVPYGGGLYLNYLFTLAWAADAAWWWVFGPDAYRRRALWVDVVLHGFMAFIALNATIVFESGIVRWSAIAVALALVALLGAAKARRPRRGAASASSV